MYGTLIYRILIRYSKIVNIITLYIFFFVLNKFTGLRNSNNI